MNITIIKFVNIPSGDHKNVVRTDKNLAIKMTKFSEKKNSKYISFFLLTDTDHTGYIWLKQMCLFIPNSDFRKQTSILSNSMIQAMSRFCHFVTHLFKVPSYLEKSCNVFVFSFLRQIALFVCFIVWS